MTMGLRLTKKVVTRMMTNTIDGPGKMYLFRFDTKS